MHMKVKRFIGHALPQLRRARNALVLSSRPSPELMSDWLEEHSSCAASPAGTRQQLIVRAHSGCWPKAKQQRGKGVQKWNLSDRKPAGTRCRYLSLWHLWMAWMGHVSNIEVPSVSQQKGSLQPDGIGACSLNRGTRHGSACVHATLLPLSRGKSLAV